jgi:hypothetical protein
MAEQPVVLDGLITFYGSHFAMRADKVLRIAGLKTALVPGPRAISPNCGVALQFEFQYAEQARTLLGQNKVQIEAIHNYLMETSGGRAK